MRLLLSICFFLLGSLVLAQDDPNIVLLDTDDTWRKEAFTFPKPFAPEVDFEGVADVRFTHGWSNQESPLFWSYAFAWKIDLDERLSDAELERYLELYFDGLMTAVNRDKELTVPVTNALFESTPIEEALSYKGKIKLYDAFFSKDILTLHVNGSYEYCIKEDKHIYLFRLSVKELDQVEWNHLNQAVLDSDICVGKDE